MKWRHNSPSHKPIPHDEYCRALQEGYTSEITNGQTSFVLNGSLTHAQRIARVMDALYEMSDRESLAIDVLLERYACDTLEDFRQLLLDKGDAATSMSPLENPHTTPADSPANAATNRHIIPITQEVA